jgi:penicillin-binding protein 2
MNVEPRYHLRVYLLTALVLLGFGVLLSRLYEFQIVKREAFVAKAPGNRKLTVREPGIRGTIKDRNGIELARNRRDYEISFNLQEIVDAYRIQHVDATVETEYWDDGIQRRRKEPNIVKIVMDQVIKPLDELGLAADFDSKSLISHYKTHGGLVPFSYRTDVSYEEFARFAEHSLDLPGVYLNVKPQREYPYKALACHTLGFLRQWATGDIPEDARTRFGYQYVGDDKGVAGVELTLDDMLRGVSPENPNGAEGYKVIVKNEKGKIIGERPADAQDPGTGAEVTLTIDAEVQYLLSNALRRAGTASGVVMDVRTGEILAMASVPDYDPNDFVPAISREKKKEYDTNPLHPQVDRAISAFSPGSTFKIPTALTGAMYGMSTRSYNCSGYVPFGNMKVGCWIAQKGGAHGGQTLPQAIQHSCNSYFMRLAGDLGPKKMADGFRAGREDRHPAPWRVSRHGDRQPRVATQVSGRPSDSGQHGFPFHRPGTSAGLAPATLRRGLLCREWRQVLPPAAGEERRGPGRHQDGPGQGRAAPEGGSDQGGHEALRPRPGPQGHVDGDPNGRHGHQGGDPRLRDRSEDRHRPSGDRAR